MEQAGTKIEWFIDKVIQLLTVVFVITLFAYMLGYLPPNAWVFETFTLLTIFTVGYVKDIKEGIKERKYLDFSLTTLIYLGGVASCIYLFMEIPRLEWYYGTVWTTTDIIFGTLMVITLFDLTRRKFGLALPIIAGVFLLYTLFGHLLPRGLFGHPGFAYDQVISYLFGPAGVFGIVFKTFVSIIFVFMLFGAFLQATGVGQFLIDLSFAIAGKFRGGPAKVTVLSSALLGSINGNAVANVATTGSITIPLMKRTGFKPSFAAGVEAAASTGGQILPPVMGAGAFIMAEFLSVPYQTVVVAALIPAILYFLGVYMMVDLEAIKLDLKSLKQRPPILNTLKQSYFLFPILVLIYAMLIANYSISRSGFYAILACIIISWLTKNHRMGTKRITRAIIDGTSSAIGIGAMCGVAGIVVGIVSMTGLGNQFSSVVLSLAGQNLFIVAIFAAIISIILGMGLPTTAAYIISMSVAVPTLVAMDVPALSAHMFVFYFSIVSAITPPVGAAFYTSAAIANSPVMRTGFQAVLIGIGAYIIPFYFISSPALLLDGSFWQITLATVSALLAMSAIIIAFQKVTFRAKHLHSFQSVLLIISSVLFIYPSTEADIFGLILFVLAFILK